MFNKQEGANRISSTITMSSPATPVVDCRFVYYQPASMFTICHVCQTNYVVAQCDRCRLVAYCSGDCQVADWAIHRFSCSSQASKTLLNSWNLGPRHGKENNDDDSDDDDKNSRHLKEPSKKPPKGLSKNKTKRESSDEENDEREKKPVSQKRKERPDSENEMNLPNREMRELESREQKRPRPLDVDDILRTNSRDEQRKIIPQFHIYQLRQWATKEPMTRLALLDQCRDDILLSSPFIHVTFRTFVQAMQVVMVEKTRGRPVANHLVERAALWYNVPTQGETVGSVFPLVPMYPLGRHYIEILHWMELETFTHENDRRSVSAYDLEAHQIYLSKYQEMVALLHGDESELNMKHPPESQVETTPMDVEQQQAQEIPDDYTWALTMGSQFHFQSFLSWFKEMRGLVQTSPSLFPSSEALMIQQYNESSSFLNLSPVAQWLLDVALNNNNIHFASGLLCYSSSTQHTSHQHEKLIMEKRKELVNLHPKGELVFDPLEDPINEFDRPHLTNMTHSSLLLGGYFSWLNIHQEPLHVLTMRQDLQLRHHHEKYIIHSRPWLLLYVMQGDWKTHTIFADAEPSGSGMGIHQKETMKSGVLVAATIAVLNSQVNLWRLVQLRHQQELDKSRGPLLALALAYGSVGILNEWYKEKDFKLGLEHMSHQIVHWHEQLVPRGKGCYELHPYHFLYHYAIVFQQPSVIRWLLQKKLIIPTWDLLLPIQMLVTQATMLQFDVDISIKQEVRNKG